MFVLNHGDDGVMKVRGERNNVRKKHKVSMVLSGGCFEEKCISGN